jgi:hypothetical protein
MAAVDADLASDYATRTLFFADDDVAEFEIRRADLNTNGPDPFVFLVDLGAASAPVIPSVPVPPTLSPLDSEAGGIGFGLRTTKARST